MDPITIEVTHSWQQGHADYRRDALILHVQLAGVVTQTYRDLITADFDRQISSCVLEFETDQRAHITGCRPENVERAVTTLRQVIAALPQRVADAHQAKELVDYQIRQDIERGLGQAPSSGQ